MNTENTKTGRLTAEEYVKPQIEAIEIDNEGILAASGDGGGFSDGGGWTS